MALYMFLYHITTSIIRQGWDWRWWLQLLASCSFTTQVPISYHFYLWKYMGKIFMWWANGKACATCIVSGHGFKPHGRRVLNYECLSLGMRYTSIKDMIKWISNFESVRTNPCVCMDPGNISTLRTNQPCYIIKGLGHPFKCLGK